MTAEAVPAPLAAAIPDANRWDVLKWGSIAGLAMVFVAVIGMAESLNDRAVVEPVLGLGYLAMIWLPLVLSYRATHRPRLEGMEAPPTGIRNVIGGAAAGLTAGALLALFILLIGNVELRDHLPNVSRGLVELLTFTAEGDPDIGRGMLIALLGTGALGAIGGSFHLVGRRLRAALVNGGMWIVAVGLLELIVTDLLEGLDTAPLIGALIPDLSAVEDWIYSPDQGVEWPAAIVIGVIGFTLSYWIGGRTIGLRDRIAAMSIETRRRYGLAAAVGFVAIGTYLPTVVGGFVNEILATVGLFLLMGLGLNIVIGFAGLLDLGYVAFFAVGAYTAAVLTSPGSPRWTPELTFWVAIPVVIIAAAIAGIVVGTPVIRMRGDYLAIVTLGFGEIARILFLSDWFKPTFGGAQGILEIPSITISRTLVLVLLGLIALAAVGWAARSWQRSDTPDSGLRWQIGALAVLAAGAALLMRTTAAGEGPIVVQGTNTQAIFYMILIFVVLAAYVSWRLQDSRIGRAWMAMREDEQVAEVMGIDIVRAKLLAFVSGAVLASFGGALFAVKIGSIFPNSFSLLVSIIVLVLIIVGGMGNIPGVAVGALMLVGVLGGPTQPGLLREFEDHKLLIYGTLLIFMMLRRPEGLLPSMRRTQELHQEEFMQDAWLRSQESTGEVGG